MKYYTVGSKYVRFIYYSKRDSNGERWPKTKELTAYQTACGHPTLKDGGCFGPHAIMPGFMESRNRRAFVDQISSIRIIVTLFSVPRESLLINIRKYEDRARIHFIPNQKVGVFVTLRAPDLIIYLKFHIKN